MALVESPNLRAVVRGEDSIGVLRRMMDVVKQALRRVDSESTIDEHITVSDRWS